MTSPHNLDSPDLEITAVGGIGELPGEQRWCGVRQGRVQAGWDKAISESFESDILISNMSKPVVIRLQTPADQRARLEALQQASAEVCDVLAPQVRDARTWNRVALHHLAFRDP